MRRQDDEGMAPASRIELIRALLPLRVMAVYELLDAEVVKLARPRYGRGAEAAVRYRRHGSKPGSVRLASYAQLRAGAEVNETLLRRLQRAYERPTYAEAKRALLALRRELEQRNQSAVGSLDEGFEETLTLHRLGVFGLLGRSFKITNCLESINALVEERCGKVDAWKNSAQKQRWFAAALVDIEPRLRKVTGYRHLPLLRQAIMRELKLEPDAAQAPETA